MIRDYKKLLAIILSLLIGIVPLQGALAGVPLLFDNGETVPLSTDIEGVTKATPDHLINHDHALHQDQTATNDGCGDGSCLFDHCVLLTALSFTIGRPAATSVHSHPDDRFPPISSISLFRPPRT